jgi:hypothetical protein
MSRRRSASGGAIGTSMILVRVPRRPRAEHNEHSCPACYSVARQPCRKVLSKPGATVLKLGGVQSTMHPQRPGARSKSRRARSQPVQTKPTPVPIEQVDPARAGFVPRNLRGVARDEQGRATTTGWSRGNTDAIPRRVRPQDE